MKIQQHNKEFWKFFSILYSSMFLLCLISAGYMNNQQNKALKQIADNNSHTTLLAISTELEFLKENAITFTSANMLRKEINYLMTSDNIDEFKRITYVNALKKDYFPNAMISSVCVYNSHYDKFYSINDGNVESVNIPQDLKFMFSGYKPYAIIPQIVDSYSGNGKSLIFSCVIPNELSRDNTITNGAMIISFSGKWFFERLQEHYGRIEQLFILTSNGNTINYINGKASFFSIPDNILKIAEANRNSTTIDKKHDCVVTHLEIEDVNWQIIRVQTISQFNSILKNTQTIIYVFYVILLIALLPLSYFLTKILHKPISHIAQMIVKNTPSAKLMDDYSIVMNFVKNNTDNFNADIVLVTENYIKSQIYGIDFSIPDYHRQQVDDIVKKEINNSAMYLFDVYPKNSQYVFSELRNDIQLQLNDLNISHLITQLNTYLILICNSDKNIIKKELEKILTDLKLKYQVNIRCFISDAIDNADCLNKVYNLLSEYSQYTLIYGNNLIIEESEINKFYNNSNSYPVNIEKEIIRLIKIPDYYSEIELVNMFDKFLENITSSNIHTFQSSILLLLLNICVDINNKIQSEVDINIYHIHQEIMHALTISEIKKIFYDFFYRIHEFVISSSSKQAIQHEQLIVTIKEYISINYSNSQLCVTEIADKLGLSPPYVSRLFAKSVGMSISKYINYIRLRKAANLLLTTDYTIKKIMQIIGYENESNFYKLFNKEFGKTPTAYRSETNDI